MESRGVYAFERIGPDLPFIPLAARRLLDALGRKLSLEGWLSLSLEDRMNIVRAGAAHDVDGSAAAIVDRANPRPSSMPVQPEPDAKRLPGELASALGGSRPLDEARWRDLHPLDRFVLVKCAPKAEKLALAYDTILSPTVTHLTRSGDAIMVDVAGKTESHRRAVAIASLRTTRSAVEAVTTGGTTKGDVLAAARIAAILASKRTAELIPLCHPVRTTRASVEFETDAQEGQLRIRASVEAVDRTGVEMEAMIAASVAALTVYDMIKSIDRWATIDVLRLESKSGGKSGELTRPPERGGS